jgi:predicted nucleic acid-binding protein
VIYLDSAAIVKLAHAEAESAALGRWLGQRRDTPWVTSALAEVEVPRALRRWAPEALGRVEPVLATLYRMEIGVEVRVAAAGLGDRLLRSLDAIHLATAQRLGSELTAFVTYDKRLLAAAGAVGLPTAAPAD